MGRHSCLPVVSIILQLDKKYPIPDISEKYSKPEFHVIDESGRKEVLIVEDCWKEVYSNGVIQIYGYAWYRGKYYRIGDFYIRNDQFGELLLHEGVAPALQK